MTVFVETRGSGPALALLHGWGLNGAVWQNIADDLSQHFTLHIVDLPGHGESGSAPVTSLAAIADAVAHALPARTHVLGWSLGGQVAMQLAAMHPERVTKLVLVATTPKFVAGDDWPHGMKPGVLADFATRLSTNYSATIRNFLALQVLHQANMRDTILQLQKAVLARGAPNIVSLMQGLEVLNEGDLRALLPLITHDTLIIQGDHDALTPEPAAHWLSTQHVRARYKLIAHAAHAPFLSHRSQFLHAVKVFLA